MPQQHYIFGYGSLICAKSRAATASALGVVGEAGDRNKHNTGGIPVRLNNWMRLWNLQGPNTYLGVQKSNTNTNSSSPRVSCVGVLVPLPSSKQNETGGSKNDEDEVLEALDRRERGYYRHSVDLSSIERVDDLLLTNIAESERCDQAIEDRYYKHTFLRRKNDTSTNGNDNTIRSPTQNDDVVCKVWIYVPQDCYSGMACPQKPILQSYVDICLRGCLSISESFAREFIASTYGWYPGHGHLLLTGHSVGEKCFESKRSVDESNAVVSSCIKHCWINDRERPIYVRADRNFSIGNSELLDALFDPQLLERRR
ncbi:unnamed protein product [Pseudo-nitzschia multistriata]|uniref:Gamma-glutamylcyclotransferase AIG2-like domain-containing protein n=1 Tax=Pseudo-nitzschia multistriata TaxID=183589 RepID=A0A448ZQL3_9STRA|nr:unnamed protein product [Pseudo-nitzschia multistriata]